MECTTETATRSSDVVPRSAEIVCAARYICRVHIATHQQRSMRYRTSRGTWGFMGGRKPLATFFAYSSRSSTSPFSSMCMVGTSLHGQQARRIIKRPGYELAGAAGGSRLRKAAPVQRKAIKAWPFSQSAPVEEVIEADAKGEHIGGLAVRPALQALGGHVAQRPRPRGEDVPCRGGARPALPPAGALLRHAARQLVLQLVAAGPQEGCQRLGLAAGSQDLWAAAGASRQGSPPLRMAGHIIGREVCVSRCHPGIATRHAVTTLVLIHMVRALAVLHAGCPTTGQSLAACSRDHWQGLCVHCLHATASLAGPYIGVSCGAACVPSAWTLRASPKSASLASASKGLELVSRMFSSFRSRCMICTAVVEGRVLTVRGGKVKESACPPIWCRGARHPSWTHARPPLQPAPAMQ